MATKQKKSRAKPAPKAAPKKTAAHKAAKKSAHKKKAPPKKSGGDDLLEEELAAARHELKRLALEENAVRRELEASLSNERNGNDRLRSELNAVRVDLKTALADLEIARADSQRESARAQAAARDLGAGLEAQRLAEHSATATREQLYELRRENERLRAELNRPETP